MDRDAAACQRGPDRPHRRRGLDVTFADGEELRTEISAKFTREAVERELAAAGLRLDGFHTDEGALFGLASASVR